MRLAPGSGPTWFALAAALLAASAAQAKPPAVEIRDAWIAATPPGAATAAGYLSITNDGPTTDRLMGGHTAAASEVVPHHMSVAGGIMRMRPIEGGLAIAAAATVKLSPSGDHLMLIGLKSPLAPGRHVRVVLDFSRAGPVTADFTVRAAAGGGMGAMHM